MMSSPCAKHHPLHPEVGVCASCLRERLANCVSTLKAFGEEEDEFYGAMGVSATLKKALGEGSEDEFYGSTEGGLDSSSTPRRDINKRALSYHNLEDKKGVYSNCNGHASHKKAMSSDGVYEGNSCNDPNHYNVRNEGGYYLEGGKESPLCEKGRPSSSNWLAALFFFKRGGGGKQRANSRECSIASWRDCSSNGGASLPPWDAPRPSSWEQLSCWEKPSSFPLKLPPYTLHSQQPPSTRSPTIKLPPLQAPPHPAQPSSFKLPPLLSSRPPLKLPPLLGSQPYLRHPATALASHLATHIACPVSSRIEMNQRCAATHAAQSRKKKVWFRVFLRNKWTVKFKRRFAQKERQDDPDSARTSSVRESDYLRHSQNNYSIQDRHSQNHSFKERNHYQNQQFSTLNRSSRAGREVLAAGSVSGRDYGAWESYYSPVHSHSFNGVQGRHRYNSSLSCVQRRESAELLRFYLTPLRGPGLLRCKIR